MAIVTIVITDQEDGNISISSEFNPPLRADTTVDDLTDAQYAAVSMLEQIRMGGDEMKFPRRSTDRRGNDVRLGDGRDGLDRRPNPLAVGDDRELSECRSLSGLERDHAGVIAVKDSRVLCHKERGRKHPSVIVPGVNPAGQPGKPTGVAGVSGLGETGVIVHGKSPVYHWASLPYFSIIRTQRRSFANCSIIFRAGPDGLRLPCSQSSIVRPLTPTSAPKSEVLSPRDRRRWRISGGVISQSL